jgi:hypothetical protein
VGTTRSDVAYVGERLSSLVREDWVTNKAIFEGENATQIQRKREVYIGSSSVDKL